MANQIRTARSTVPALAVFLLSLGGAQHAEAQGQEYLYVENAASGEITVIEVPSHRVVGQIPASRIGQHPDDVIHSSDGEILFISRRDAQDVVAVSTATEEVLWRVPVGGAPHHLTLSRDDRLLYVPLFNDRFMAVIDTEKREVVDRVPVNHGPHGTQLSPDGRRVYVGALLGDAITVVEVGTHRVVKSIPTPEGVRPFKIAPDERRLYAQLSKLHGFVEVDLENDRITKTIHLPTLGKSVPPSAYQAWPHTVGHGMELTSDGEYLFVAATLYDFVAIYSLPSLELLAAIPVGEEPGWLTLSKDGRFCYASNRRGNTVSVISVAERKEIARIEVGEYPQRMTSVVVPRRRVTSMP